MPDGCGGVLSCGSCGEGESCGGGGTANVCGGGDGCIPITCEAAGKTCGVISDGCGATLECGTCGSGTTCTENVCVGGDGGTCAPTTCAAEGATCGELSDGCGGTLICGSCGDGQSCNGENVCEASPAGKRVKWLTLLSGEDIHTLRDIATARGGVVAAVGHSWLAEPGRRESTDTLARFSLADGTQEWSFESPQGQVTYSEVGSSPDGARFFATGGGSCSGCGGTLDSFSTTDGGGWHRLRFYDGELSRSDLSPDGRGGVAYVQQNNNDGATEVGVFEANGTHHAFGPAVRESTHVPGSVRFTALARDPDGNLIAAATTHAPATLAGLKLGRADGRTFVVFKLTPDAGLLWHREYKVNGEVSAIGTSAKGTIVVALKLEEGLLWGKDTIGPGAALLVMEANGAERWARALPGAGTGELAVDPTGEAIVATSAGCDRHIQRYALDGRHLWTHTITTSSCNERTQIRVLGIAVVDGNAIVGGQFSGAADFGDGHQAQSEPEEPQTFVGDGFLLNLGR